MRIAVDARSLKRHESGPGVYTRRLLERLVGLAPQWSFHLYWAVREPGVEVPAGAAVQARELGRPLGRRAGNLLFEQVLLPRAVREDACDLLWSPVFVLPVWKRCAQVVTMHDVIPLVFAEEASLARRTVYHRLLRLNARAADRVITVSEHSGRDLRERLQVDPARLRVIPNGIDASLRPLEAADEGRLAGLLRKLNVRDPYILCTAGLLPRKNAHTLLEAFAALRGGPCAPAALVLTGRTDASGDGRYHEALIRRSAELGLEGTVCFAGHRSREELRLLYGGAVCSVEPSLYEGFGFPVAESMACGCPVVASDRSSLPEVAGGAALLVDPRSPAAIAAAVGRIATDPALRRDLRARGLARARRFSWDESAAALLAVFRELLEERAGARGQAPQAAAGSPREAA